jgi:hypothetical protein
MPTAEMSAPAFAGLGIRSYSSSVHSFVPALASEFYRALRADDAPTMTRLIEGFYRPFVEFRDKARGYTVSLLKTGLDLIGRPAGPVRPPLVNPPEEHRALLRDILAALGISTIPGRWPTGSKGRAILQDWCLPPAFQLSKIPRPLPSTRPLPPLQRMSPMLPHPWTNSREGQFPAEDADWRRVAGEGCGGGGR